MEAVLAHYSEEAQFVSPVARNLVGRPGLRNKQELEHYWRTALARISTLQFRLDHAAWDEKRLELNVVYEANLKTPCARQRSCAGGGGSVLPVYFASWRVRGSCLAGRRPSFTSRPSLSRCLSSMSPLRITDDGIISEVQ